MVQGESHQAPHGTRGGLEDIHPHCCSEQAPQHPPACDLGPHRVLLGISKELNAQPIATSHPFPLLPSGSRQRWSWLMVLLESLMFNLLLQSGGGRRGDSTRSRPGSARKITSCSFSWKNTWPQTHHIILYKEASAPRPGWCHLP